MGGMMRKALGYLVLLILLLLVAILVGIYVGNTPTPQMPEGFSSTLSDGLLKLTPLLLLSGALIALYGLSEGFREIVEEILDQLGV